MINTCYILLLGLLLLFTPDSMPITNPMKLVGPTTTTGVGLGRPKKDCKGKGLCIITGEIREWKVGNRQTIARLTFNGETLSTMFIAHSDLNKTAREEFFAGRHFVMEEPYESSLKVGKQTFQVHIEKGQYPIRKSDRGFTIDFR